MMKPMLILKPATQHYIEVNSDPNADTWYHHRQGMIYSVAGTNENSFKIIDDETDTDVERQIPADDCRLFSSVLEYLKLERVFDLYRDEETGKITLDEMCDQYFGVTLSRVELESLAHEILLFAWAIPSAPEPEKK